MSPSAIFFTILNDVSSRLEKARRPRTLHDPRLANELRAALFQLEAWARLHRNWPDESHREMFSELRDRAKEIEDVFGGLDMANVLLAEALKRKIPKLVEHQRVELALHEKKLKKTLRSGGWMPKSGRSRTEKIAAKLERVDWPSEAEHMSYLCSEIAKEIAAFQVRFETELRPLLEKPSYVHDVVENVVHEWRRQIRWYAIYMQTSRGLIALDRIPKKPKAAEAKLIRALRGNRFAKLPGTKKTHVRVDPIAYFELTRLIDELGEAKESGEMFYYIRDRLQASGAAKVAEADKIVRKLYGDAPKDAPKRVHSLVAEFDRFKPLDKIRRDIVPKSQGATPK